MNWDFLAHVVRDVFPTPISPIVYGTDASCLDAFWDTNHSMGLHVLHSDDIVLPPGGPYLDSISFWDIDKRETKYGADYCDLFMSFGYTPEGSEDQEVKMTEFINWLVKPDGLLFLCNPGPWADSFSNSLKPRNDIINEIKKYSMFTNERVLVYENI